MNDLTSFYSSKVKLYQHAIEKIKKSIFWTATGRLASFILLIASIYLYFHERNEYYLLLLALSIISFLFLVKKSNALNEKKTLLENLYFVNENELNILQGSSNKFDNGNRFISNESYYADLDVFGEASLFHLLNRTNTQHGTSALADLLKHSFLDSSLISKWQQAIKTFSSQTSLQEEVIASALANKDDKADMEGILDWLNEPVVLINNRWLSIAKYVLPVLNVAALLVYLVLDNYSWLAVTVLVSWIHVGMFSRYVNRQHLLLGRRQEMLEQYASILYKFSDADEGESVLIKEYKDIAQQGYAEVKRLSKLTNLLDQRYNMLVNIFFNSLFLYDIQTMMLLEQWKVRNKAHLSNWINCVATIEVLTSLSRFAFNHPTYCYPVINSNLVIEAEEVSHPLIPLDESIPNNIFIGKSGKLLLITGSNMSGKTTFLRTIGSNVLLAQCGAPVCAKSFGFSPVDIYTSIRISDSLQEHTSYFMAELKRLSEIKESIASNAPSLVLIDEILRGTNSEDKYYGSAEFVKKLIEYNCLTLFATHDLKLSELEHEYKGLIENYCFESVIEGDNLSFDYRILRGVAQNKNASFLMKKMKII